MFVNSRTPRIPFLALALCAAVFMLLFSFCAGTSGKKGGAPLSEASATSPASEQTEPEQAEISALRQDGNQNPPEPAVAGREKLSVAVYTAGEERKEIMGAYKILGGELARALSESDKYAAVNRTDAILDILGKEHIYQRSGAVLDEQIKDLGKQFGAQYLCIAEISEVKGGTYYLDARLIDVVTAKTAGSATAGSNLADINEMLRVARELANDLIGGKNAGQAPVSGQISADKAEAPKPVASAGASAPAEFTDAKTGVEMVLVRGGTFTMGCAAEHGNCQEYEKPAHRVTVGDFYISKYTVTQKQWEKIMGTNPSMIKGDFAAVEGLTWDDAQEYITRLNSSSGRVYRLPTEAEWEYAARGGAKSKGYKYAGSDNINDVAWYSRNTPHLAVRKVGAKAPNELGLYDMCGNVLEWVSDWFAAYPSRSQTDPIGPSTGSYRVLRGGSYHVDAPYCRVHTRLFIMPDMDYYPSIGLRLAMSPANAERAIKESAQSDKTKNESADRNAGGKIKIDMVFVKGGTFTMGCVNDPDNLCFAHEKPAHEVTLGDFSISKYPVTQKLWHDVMGVSIRQQRDNVFMNTTEPLNGEGDNYPVYYVTYKHVTEFISALNEKTGKRYRLPTEAEWEYAARGGAKSRGYAFAGSNDMNDVGWYFVNSGDKLLKTDKDTWKMKDKDMSRIMSLNNNRLRQVGGKKPNELGIYDMSGNVKEWVSDYYDEEYYEESPENNPKGPVPAADIIDRADRVVRGCSWREDAARCRVSNRRDYPPIIGEIDLGFRLVLPPER